LFKPLGAAAWNEFSRLPGSAGHEALLETDQGGTAQKFRRVLIDHVRLPEAFH
jgi:hypothetical protein